MEGYLHQIANRDSGVNLSPGISPVSSETPATDFATDPFEQTLLVIPKAPGMAAEEKASPVSIPPASQVQNKKSAPPVEKISEAKSVEMAYFMRHVIRTEQEEASLIKQTPPVSDTNYRAGITVLTPGINNEVKNEGHRPASLEQPVPHDIRSAKIPELLIPEKVNDLPGKMRPASIEPKTDYLPANNITQMLPVIKQDIVKVTEKKQTGPRLVIGRINIQVLPAEKQQVVQKIEKRTIIESKPVSRQVNNKFIFGLGQL